MTSIVPMEHNSTGAITDYGDDLVLEEKGQSECIDVESPGLSKV